MQQNRQNRATSFRCTDFQILFIPAVRQHRLPNIRLFAGLSRCNVSPVGSSGNVCNSLPTVSLHRAFLARRIGVSTLPKLELGRGAREACNREGNGGRLSEGWGDPGLGQLTYLKIRRHELYSYSYFPSFQGFSWPAGSVHLILFLLELASSWRLTLQYGLTTLGKECPHSGSSCLSGSLLQCRTLEEVTISSYGLWRRWISCRKDRDRRYKSQRRLQMPLFHCSPLGLTVDEVFRFVCDDFFIHTVFDRFPHLANTAPLAYVETSVWTWNSDGKSGNLKFVPMKESLPFLK